MAHSHKPEDPSTTHDIDLVDLLSVIAQDRATFLLTCIAIVALGGVYIFGFKSSLYEYRTPIEIGTQLIGEETVPIETASETKAKIETSYLPQTVAQYYERNPDEKRIYRINVRIPQDSDLVVLSRRGSKAEAPALEVIFGDVVQRLVNDHERILSVVKKSLENELASQEFRMASLQDRRAILEHQLKRSKTSLEKELADLKDLEQKLQADLKRFEELKQLVKTQIAEVDTRVKADIARRVRAVSEATNDEARAMTMLMLSQQIQRNLQLLADLRERLAILLPEQMDELHNELESVRREQSVKKQEMTEEIASLTAKIEDVDREVLELKNQIAMLDLRIENLQATRAIDIASRSVEPVGPGKLTMLALALIAGLLMGCIVVFARHLGMLVRHRRGLGSPAAG